MGDDKVVRVDFGGGRKIEPEPVSEDVAQTNQGGDHEVVFDPGVGEDLYPSGMQAHQRAAIDLMFMLENKDYLQEMRQKLERTIGDDIFAMADYVPNEANIRLRQEGMADWTVKYMCSVIEKAERQQWRASPSFFGALTLEYQSRVTAATQLLPD